MKFFLVGIFVFLAGCNALVKVNDKIIADVQPITTADLQNAVMIANANGDTIGAQCWQGALDWLNSIPAAPVTPALPQANGVASALEIARTVQPIVLPVLPPFPLALRQSCPTVLVDLENAPIFLALKNAAALKAGGKR